MAPLAAKWGRLWRALLGQARTGHEAPDVPTSPSPARLACPHGPDRPPSAGGSPALRSSGLRQGPPRGREGTRLRAPCVSRAPEGPPRQLPNRREPPREAGQLTGGGPVHGWQLRLLLRLEDAATRRQVSQQHVSGWHPERETQTPGAGEGQSGQSSLCWEGTRTPLCRLHTWSPSARPSLNLHCHHHPESDLRSLKDKRRLQGREGATCTCPLLLASSTGVGEGQAL